MTSFTWVKVFQVGDEWHVSTIRTNGTNPTAVGHTCETVTYTNREDAMDAHAAEVLRGRTFETNGKRPYQLAFARPDDTLNMWFGPY